MDVKILGLGIIASVVVAMLSNKKNLASWMEERRADKIDLHHGTCPICKEPFTVREEYRGSQKISVFKCNC